MSIVVIMGMMPASILNQINNLDFKRIAEVFPIIEEALKNHE